MRTVEIVKNEWSQFVGEINRTAARRPVRLEVENLELGDQHMARMLPLQGLDLDLEGQFVEVLVGLASIFSHRIEQPTRFYARYDEDNDLDCLCIEDASAGKTLILFERLPKLPGEWGFPEPEEEILAPP